MACSAGRATGPTGNWRCGTAGGTRAGAGRPADGQLRAQRLERAGRPGPQVAGQAAAAADAGRGPVPGGLPLPAGAGPDRPAGAAAAAARGRGWSASATRSSTAASSSRPTTPTWPASSSTSPVRWAIDEPAPARPPRRGCSSRSTPSGSWSRSTATSACSVDGAGAGRPRGAGDPRRPAAGRRRADEPRGSTIVAAGPAADRGRRAADLQGLRRPDRRRSHVLCAGLPDAPSSRLLGVHRRCSIYRLQRQAERPGLTRPAPESSRSGVGAGRFREARRRVSWRSAGPPRTARNLAVCPIQYRPAASEWDAEEVS